MHLNTVGLDDRKFLASWSYFSQSELLFWPEMYTVARAPIDADGTASRQFCVCRTVAASCYWYTWVFILLFITTETILSRCLRHAINDLLLTVYKDLPHPPSSYLALPNPASSVGPPSKVKYAFRSADGSNYNPLFPTMGRANSPYARSVPSTNFVPSSALPDAGLVFDTLLRREKFEVHPGGISSLFFAFADLVIHSIFNTKYPDFTINQASSYLDLSILYGCSDQEVNSVRRRDGTGMLWNDVFADVRLLDMPPSVCALLVLFNRNHNVSISLLCCAVLNSFEFSVCRTKDPRHQWMGYLQDKSGPNGQREMPHSGRWNFPSCTARKLWAFYANYFRRLCGCNPWSR